MKSLVARPGAFRWVVAGTLALGTWLLVTAMPVSADGGPHVAAANSGISTLAADGCAGCHRAHTASGEGLLVSADGEQLCLACHGATGTGATTDVESGVQYTSSGRGATPILGALRSGGFVDAAIDSANPARRLNGTGLAASSSQWAKVRVLATAGEVTTAPSTSAHLNLAGSAVGATTVAWGNGDIGLGLTGAGPVVSMGCTSCHNPHGNGNYRILNPAPAPLGAGFVAVPTLAAPAEVAVADTPVDNPDPTESDTKNYTVIQVKGTGTPPDLSSMLIYADDVTKAGYGPTTGDYWHVRVPWNSATGTNDAPNGRPANAVGGIVGFDTQITAWCTTCHTRYASASGHDPSGDALYAFRHETIGNRACTTCHVGHGSNAAMTGDQSRTQPFPDGSVPSYLVGGTPTGDSRLLKVDGRGTCQLCHDPTNTAFATQPYTGPLPTPGVP